MLAETVGPVWEGIGPLGLEGMDTTEAPSVFNTFLSATIGLLTVIAGIYFIFLFMMGAIGILTSGGDKAGLEVAKKRLTTGILGLVVVISAVFVINLIGYLLGLDILHPFKELMPG